MNEFEEQLIELQTRLAFQEDTLHQLNEVITRQDQHIIQLQEQVRSIAKRLDDTLFVQDSGSDTPADERPPHY